MIGPSMILDLTHLSFTSDIVPLRHALGRRYGDEEVHQSLSDADIQPQVYQQADDDDGERGAFFAVRDRGRLGFPYRANDAADLQGLPAQPGQ